MEIFTSNGWNLFPIIKKFDMKQLLVLAFLAASLAAGQTPHKTSKADVDRYMKELSNWGRWGKQDQLGTYNLITPAKRKEAAALVKEGVSVSLAHNVEKVAGPDNNNPFKHTIEDAGAYANEYYLDSYAVNYHGFAHTHMDSLCHMFHDGQMYNGFSTRELTKQGAQKLAIDGFKNGILSRAILMDIPKLKGVPFLPAGTAIYPEDLEAWEKKTGIKVRAGDVVLIYTGRWAARTKNGAWEISKKAAGLHASCAPWLKQRDVAILGSDGASDVLPSLVDGVTQPIHQLVLIAMGMPILDNLDMEELSKAAAKYNRYEFMLSAAPLAVAGGTGSPLNPIATF